MFLRFQLNVSKNASKNYSIFPNHSVKLSTSHYVKSCDISMNDFQCVVQKQCVFQRQHPPQLCPPNLQHVQLIQQHQQQLKFQRLQEKTMFRPLVHLLLQVVGCSVLSRVILTFYFSKAVGDTPGVI